MAAKCKHLSFASVILAVRPYCLACVINACEGMVRDAIDTECC